MFCFVVVVVEVCTCFTFDDYSGQTNCFLLSSVLTCFPSYSVETLEVALLDMRLRVPLIASLQWLEVEFIYIWIL